MSVLDFVDYWSQYFFYNYYDRFLSSVVSKFKVKNELACWLGLHTFCLELISLGIWWFGYTKGMF